ncbi:MAG: biotin biosynthesis cytochrome P450 [Vulcanimicrobiaceae bacterium]
MTELLDPEVLADPYPLYRRLRTEAPVCWDPFLHAWVVTRYADVVTVLHDFSAERTPSPEKLAAIGLGELGPIARLMVRQMLFLDAPAHTRVRRLAAHAFTPQRVAMLRDHIGEIVDRLLDVAVSARRMDVVADFADPLPYTITAEMLGVPVADAPKLKAWSQDFAEMLGNFQHNPERAASVARSVEAMTAYFRDAVAEAKRSPRPGLIGAFVESDADGDRFSDEEIVANTIVTMVGGQETTTNLIANGVLTLARFPDEARRLHDDPALLPSAIEEMLRFEPPSQQTARLARADVRLGDRAIRRGDAVIAVMAAANRDPERFSEPDRFDVGRADNRHLSFGWAAHFCFGAALARLEAEIAFAGLLRRCPHLRVSDAGFAWRTNLGLRGLTALPVTF